MYWFYWSEDSEQRQLQMLCGRSMHIDADDDVTKSGCSGDDISADLIITWSHRQWQYWYFTTWNPLKLCDIQHCLPTLVAEQISLQLQVMEIMQWFNIQEFCNEASNLYLLLSIIITDFQSQKRLYNPQCQASWISINCHQSSSIVPPRFV